MSTLRSRRSQANPHEQLYAEEVIVREQKTPRRQSVESRNRIRSGSTPDYHVKGTRRKSSTSIQRTGARNGHLWTDLVLSANHALFPTRWTLGAIIKAAVCWISLFLAAGILLALLTIFLWAASSFAEEEARKLLCSGDMSTIAEIKHTPTILWIQEKCARYNVDLTEPYRVLVNDPMGADAVALWMRPGTEVAIARKEGANISTGITRFIARLHVSQERIFNGEQLHIFASRYLQTHDKAEDLLDSLAVNDSVFRHTIARDMNLLDDSLKVYEDENSGTSFLMEFLYTYVSVLFLYSPAGRILFDFEDFAQVHKRALDALAVEQAQQFHDVLEEERKSRGALRTRLDSACKEWDDNCVKHDKPIWYLGYERTSIVRESVLCHEESPEHLREHLKYDDQEWLRSAGGIAERSLIAYQELASHYVNITAALEEIPRDPRSRRFALKKARGFLGDIRSGLAESKEALEKSLRGEELFSIEAKAYNSRWSSR